MLYIFNCELYSLIITYKMVGSPVNSDQNYDYPQISWQLLKVLKLKLCNQFQDLDTTEVVAQKSAACFIQYH